MKAIIRNLTPHTVTIITGKEQLIYMPIYPTPRLSTNTEFIGAIDGVPLTKTVFSKVQDLPPQKEGVYLIVSRLVLSACSTRKDLLVPNELVRNDKGKIIGCKSLAQN